MQLYYTRKLKTQLTNPSLPQTSAESYLAPGFFIPPSALMRDDWGRVSTGTVICAHWANKPSTQIYCKTSKILEEVHLVPPHATFEQF